MIEASYDVYLWDQKARKAELFPTDVPIAVCLWDGLNYVQSNGPHIQHYLQIPPEQLPSGMNNATSYFILSLLPFGSYGPEKWAD